MSEQITFIDAFIAAIQRASLYNQNDQEPPAVVLWTDQDRQWEALLPLLRERLPQLLTLGSYHPEERIGPAYWLRCVIARTLPAIQLPKDTIPIIYLPGLSKHDIRAIEETPKILQPLAELQYRGVLWSHKNGRDWTILGFLQSYDPGPGIEVSNDSATREAARRALLKLIDEPLEHLKKEAPLRAPFFDALLNPDEVRNILLWLNDATGYPKRCSREEWTSFCNLCQRKYSFHPEKDSIINALQLFGESQDVWEIVWNRFKESPLTYPQLPDLLRRARPQQLSLLDHIEAWPQDNEQAETKLRNSLLAFRDLSPSDVRARINKLEEAHAIRRSWVWAVLKQSPMAMALHYLVVLAKETEQMLGGTSVQEIMKAFTMWGWKADAAVIDALTEVHAPEDVAAVKATIAVLYRPWLESAASALQKVVYSDHSSHAYHVEPLPEPDAGTCILFSDGLRYDVGQRLIAALETRSFQCQGDSHLVPFPTITSTAKPAISPVAHLISGKTGPGLEPIITKSGSKVNAKNLRNLLTQSGYQILMGEELGDPSGKAWTEMGAIDSNGHQNGWRLAYYLAAEVFELERRIDALLTWGWSRVVVVTDHGWLLLPGALPKADLPEHLTYVRKGRCAQLKESANPDQETVPWYWNNETRFALAPNICCYETNKEYEHGGLSPQECFVPVITVTKQTARGQAISIENIVWRGFRCAVTISGVQTPLLLDIRTKAGDKSTSVLVKPKSISEDGNASVLVSDEDRSGEVVQIVIMDSSGTVQKQMPTIVGG